MSAKTGISWTDSTWNPVRGCSRVSEGCRNCYAERVAARFSGPGQPYEGLARMTEGGEPRWTGKVTLVEKHLEDPFRWRKPRRIFVNSMSDLFHESLSDEAIARVFAIMALAPRHTFQVLTKRPERMRYYFAWGSTGHLRADIIRGLKWPLPNVWLGVSVEDQKTADERIPLLLQTPAAKKFVSYEPALHPVEFSSYDFSSTAVGGLDWVIVGGESGPGARPCHLEWIRGTVQQCANAKVPCFVKQLGSHCVLDLEHDWNLGRGWREGTRLSATGFDYLNRVHLLATKGDDPTEWPEDLRVQEFPS